MHKTIWLGIFILAVCSNAFGQIDPEKRQLFQLGYNQPIEGRGPISGYAFYYRNDPDFFRTNMTLRLAIAPIYIDSELGFAHALGEQTDFAIGAAGGGFADSYSEVRQGKLIDEESFTGHGGEISASIYHRFNPKQMIPLSAILRGSVHQTVYTRDSDTSDLFDLPQDRTSFNVRAGFRWGGKEPVMSPELAMEVSAWYEGQFRTEYGRYGFNDRTVRPSSHLFWSRALLIYTLPELKHNFGLSLTAGTSLAADRFSSYRLGGVLPLIAEFPLSLPGYYFQEISARRFALLSGQYTVPLDSEARWNVTAMGTIATVDYVSGLKQNGSTHSGAGLGFGYKSPKGTQIILAYSYGFNAIRSHGRGAQSIGLIFQYDLEARQRSRVLIDIDSPYKSRGLFRILGE